MAAIEGRGRIAPAGPGPAGADPAQTPATGASPANPASGRLGTRSATAQTPAALTGGAPSRVQSAALTARSTAAKPAGALASFAALFDRMGASLRNLFTRQAVVQPAAGPRVQAAQASPGAARSTPTPAAPQRLALQASVRTTAFGEAVGRFQAELGRSPQTQTPAQLLAMAEQIEERFIGAGARQQVELPQALAEGFQNLVFELQIQGSSRLDATALGPLQAALAQATAHLQAATDPAVQRIQQGLQEKLQQDADTFGTGAELPSGSSNLTAPGAAAAAAQFNELAQHFSQAFIKDLLRNGITVNGQQIARPPAGDTAGALATLQNLVAAFGGDAELAGRTTRMLAQNVNGAFEQVLLEDTATQAGVMGFLMEPDRTDQTLSLAIDRQPDATWQASYTTRMVKPTANQELQRTVVLGLDVSQPRVTVSVKGFDMQVGAVREPAAPQRAAGTASQAPALSGMARLRDGANPGPVTVPRARSPAEAVPAVGTPPDPAAAQAAVFSDLQETLAQALAAGVPARELTGNIDIAMRDGVITADQAQALKQRITPDASPIAPQAVKAEPTLGAAFQPLSGLQFMYRDQHVSALGSIYQERARATAPDVIFTAPVSNLEGASLADIFRGAAFEQHFGNDFKMAIPIHSGAQDAGHWTGVFVSVDTTGRKVDILGVDSLGGNRPMPAGIRAALQELFSDPVFFEGFDLNFGVTEPAYRQGSTLSCGPCTMENLLHLATDAPTPDAAQATDMAALRLRQALALQSAA